MSWPYEKQEDSKKVKWQKWLLIRQHPYCFTMLRVPNVKNCWLYWRVSGAHYRLKFSTTKSWTFSRNKESWDSMVRCPYQVGVWKVEFDCMYLQVTSTAVCHGLTLLSEPWQSLSNQPMFSLLPQPRRWSRMYMKWDSMNLFLVWRTQCHVKGEQTSFWNCRSYIGWVPLHATSAPRTKRHHHTAFWCNFSQLQ